MCIRDSQQQQIKKLSREKNGNGGYQIPRSVSALRQQQQQNHQQILQQQRQTQFCKQYQQQLQSQEQKQLCQLSSVVQQCHNNSKVMQIIQASAQSTPKRQFLQIKLQPQQEILNQHPLKLHILQKLKQAYQKRNAPNQVSFLQQQQPQQLQLPQTQQQNEKSERKGYKSPHNRKFFMQKLLQQSKEFNQLQKQLSNIEQYSLYLSKQNDYPYQLQQQRSQSPKLQNPSFSKIQNYMNEYNKLVNISSNSKDYFTKNQLGITNREWDRFQQEINLFLDCNIKEYNQV
eukprot:TRINITY_DN15419_c0_g1_i2.p1 TRINITY_DN15419_c0_g1~~TRINITY_DN15419_c0_g1_i2.p1  ORF type:complete len:287 (+),score=50.50 TRINITY_DN15419_c0_g1_i2:86-946(+)